LLFQEYRRSLECLGQSAHYQVASIAKVMYYGGFFRFAKTFARQLVVNDSNFGLCDHLTRISHRHNTLH
jgi:hypothetical protein